MLPSATKHFATATACKLAGNNKISLHKLRQCYQLQKIVYQSFFAACETTAPQSFHRPPFWIRGLIIVELMKKYVTFSKD